MFTVVTQKVDVFLRYLKYYTRTRNTPNRGNYYTVEIYYLQQTSLEMSVPSGTTFVSALHLRRALYSVIEVIILPENR